MHCTFLQCCNIPVFVDVLEIFVYWYFSVNIQQVVHLLLIQQCIIMLYIYGIFGWYLEAFDTWSDVWRKRMRGLEIFDMMYFNYLLGYIYIFFFVLHLVKIGNLGLSLLFSSSWIVCIIRHIIDICEVLKDTKFVFCALHFVNYIPSNTGGSLY